jgi:hypothetical protein
MRFRNPWIDARIVQLRSEQATAYLQCHGWNLLGAAENPLFLMFEGPNPEPNSPPVLVPLKLDQGAMLQRMVELVGEVAEYENRWAVDVLADMLSESADKAPTNGPATSSRAEHASRRPRLLSYAASGWQHRLWRDSV